MLLIYHRLLSLKRCDSRQPSSLTGSPPPPTHRGGLKKDWHSHAKNAHYTSSGGELSSASSSGEDDDHDRIRGSIAAGRAAKAAATAAAQKDKEEAGLPGASILADEDDTPLVLANGADFLEMETDVAVQQAIRSSKSTTKTTDSRGRTTAMVSSLDYRC